MTRTVEILAVVLFGLAIVHTFLVSYFQSIASHYASGSLGENVFHFLGEVEVVFGLWAAVLCLGIALLLGEAQALHFLESSNFTEPAFVFVILVMASTKPVLFVAELLISGVAKLVPLPGAASFYVSALIIGPLLGSFITEPAAMTVTALLLKERFFDKVGHTKFLYLTLGVLFVNVSIGGVLTPYAAPPVLMVAAKWNWDFAYMFENFGWQSIVAVVINAGAATAYGFNYFPKAEKKTRKTNATPFSLSLIHLVFLAAVVHYAHHPLAFLGVFLFFLGLVAVTREYQNPLKLRQGLLVGFFLAGLVVLGSLQGWWLKPLLESLNEVKLYLGAVILTAVTDNAALTFLGSQVPTLTEGMKHSLVSGAVVGGGLTVIANAPNPIGFSVLQPSFGKKGISPLGLFFGALAPTLVALLAFWFLPHRG